MFEDILRAAKKANGENFDKPRTYPMLKPPPEYDAPAKWYEKKWGIGLLLIICFPLGAILLWQNPRYSNQIKGGITAAFIFLILFFPFHKEKISTSPTHKHETPYTQSSNSYDNLDRTFLTYQGSYGDVGYLNKGAEWLDNKGNFHQNSKKVKVEIGKQKIVASDGKLTQFYFLEGSNAGSWGYVSESSISR